MTQTNSETTQNFKTGEIWNFALVFVFQILSPNLLTWSFLPKKYQLSNLNKILSVSYFAGTDFKSDFRF